MRVTNSFSRPIASGARGFSMIELLIAALVLLFGVAAVVQLVPNAMQANLRSKQDSTAVVVAERLLDQMLSQPMTAANFTSADGRVCDLGSTANPNVFFGSAVMNQGGRTVINFNGATVNGYNYAPAWVDPNEPNAAGYEIRWAVVTRVSGANAVHKRFLVGVWKRGIGGRNMIPVTVEGAVGR